MQAYKHVKANLKDISIPITVAFAPADKIIVWLALSIIFTVNNTIAQNTLDVLRGDASGNSWVHFSDAPNSLYHHLAGQAYELLDERANVIETLDSQSDWQQYQKQIRHTLSEILGPFKEKTPLNARITRTIEKDGYRIEHIIYESQPGFYVTSTLFIPDAVEIPAPAVIYLSGHTQEGYRSDTYQHKMLNLVKKGFIVFAIDPVGQGERIEYYDPQAGSSIVGSATREHSYSGMQAFLTGSSLARYMTWDGIRAVDYLVTRDEVDSERIGMTGRSGGGTQTAYIAAMDERIYAAAPEAYITNFKRLLQSIGPQDAEQNLFHGIASGIDHADFLHARAPKPTLMISTTEDFFSIQGARESAAEIKKMYDALGASENFMMVEDAGGHQSTRKNREAMYAFFQHHLDNPGSPVDEEVELLSDDELRVTHTGQVSTSLGGETVHSMNLIDAKERMQNLKESRENLPVHLPDAVKKAKRLAGYQEPVTIDSPVFTGRIQRDGYVIDKYFVKGGGNYVIPFLLIIPNEVTGKAVIYLHPDGKAAEASENGEIEWLVKNGFMVLAPDLIGTGEMGSGEVRNYTTNVKHFASVSFDLWPASVLIGRSLTGIQTGDVIRLTRLLQQKFGAENIYGLASRGMSPVLLHAAAFDRSIERVALIEPYVSYRSIVANRFYDPGFHLSGVAGSVGVYDLPDLAASLAPGKLFIMNITDGAGEQIKSPEDLEDLSIIKKAYEFENASDQLKIISGNDSLYEWID